MTAQPAGAPAHPASVDDAEVARFEALAETWWDPNGAFRPLHRLNPVRIAFIRDALAKAHGRVPTDACPLRAIRLLDIGCGGGLIAEPMARLGAIVTAIDPAEGNIRVARAHAEQAGLSIDYRPVAAEALVAEGARFDCVLALEVIEHVADLDAFFGLCAGLLAPHGALILATLNRTALSFALGIVAAEYVLGWLPRGTHQWAKFVRPSELVRGLARHGVRVEALTGVSYDPLRERFALSRSLGVNYMALGIREQA